MFISNFFIAFCSASFTFLMHLMFLRFYKLISLKLSICFVYVMLMFMFLLRSFVSFLSTFLQTNFSLKLHFIFSLNSIFLHSQIGEQESRNLSHGSNPPKRVRERARERRLARVDRKINASKRHPWVVAACLSEWVFVLFVGSICATAALEDLSCGCCKNCSTLSSYKTQPTATPSESGCVGYTLFCRVRSQKSDLFRTIPHRVVRFCVWYFKPEQTVLDLQHLLPVCVCVYVHSCVCLWVGETTKEGNDTVYGTAAFLMFHLSLKDA